MNYAHRSSIRSVPLVVASISAFLALAASVSSASIVYTFTGSVLTPASDDIAEYNAGSMTIDATLFGTTGFSTSSNSTGAYLDASGSTNWYASDMNAQTTVNALTPYLDFTLTPESGESVVVQSFSFGVRVIASDDPTLKAGSGSAGQPAPTEYAVRSSLDSYSANLASGNFPVDDFNWYRYDNALSITGAVDQPVTMRLYLLDAGSGDRAGEFRIDDVTISSVPEPATFALLGGFVCLGLVLLRRRLHQD